MAKNVESLDVLSLVKKEESSPDTQSKVILSHIQGILASLDAGFTVQQIHRTLLKNGVINCKYPHFARVISQYGVGPDGGSVGPKVIGGNLPTAGGFTESKDGADADELV